MTPLNFVFHPNPHAFRAKRAVSFLEDKSLRFAFIVTVLKLMVFTASPDTPK
jgi:hypothetical protein